MDFNFMGIGPIELLVIIILAFLFFGPEKLPGMAVKAGKLYRSFRKATSELSRTLSEELSVEDKPDKESKISALPGPINGKDQTNIQTTV